VAFFFFAGKNSVFADINKTFKKLNIGIAFSKKLWYNKNIIIPKGYLYGS
jgi:hypothetical protein